MLRRTAIALAGPVLRWWTRRRRSRTHTLPNHSDAPPEIGTVRLSGMRRNIVAVRVGRGVDAVVLAGPLCGDFPRRWRCRAAGAGAAGLLLNRIRLLTRFTPGDLGMSSGAVLVEEGRPRVYYGPDEDLTDALRR